ncbi:C40 family peptidase [Paracoccus sp. p4-l81]|uniref:C40 family peptidase n=1 Tax=Paracoccus sp. p4-l81 TaxID=3342806 RepID=UPI0035B7A3A4
MTDTAQPRPDRRLTPANDRVAHASLKGLVDAPRYTRGSPARIVLPVVDLCAAPDGARDRQMLMGASVTVLERRQGWAFVVAGDDGYCGYVRSNALGPAQAATHRVIVPASHLYSRADLKSHEVAGVSMGVRLAIDGAEGRFLRSQDGLFIPECHVAPLEAPPADPVALAETLIGTPYLWGGNSRAGIDCSGLVQLCWQVAGRAAPGDSDMQARGLGQPLPDSARLRRGDLVFWRGHVAIVTGPDRIIHANAHRMAVTHEGLADAITRIRAGGEGEVTIRRRDDSLGG